MADILTKFDILKKEPEIWIEHQTRLIQGGWLNVEHPDSWTCRVISESKAMLDSANLGDLICLMKASKTLKD